VYVPVPSSNRYGSSISLIKRVVGSLADYIARCSAAAVNPNSGSADIPLNFFFRVQMGGIASKL